MIQVGAILCERNAQRAERLAPPPPPTSVLFSEDRPRPSDRVSERASVVSLSLSGSLVVVIHFTPFRPLRRGKPFSWLFRSFPYLARRPAFNQHYNRKSTALDVAPSLRRSALGRRRGISIHRFPRAPALPFLPSLFLLLRPPLHLHAVRSVDSPTAS